MSAPQAMNRALWIGAGPVGALAAYALLAWLVPAMPEPARRTAGVLVWMTMWWVGEAVPLGVTALLPLGLFPVLGVLGLRDAAVPYADRIIFLFLGGFILALSIEKWGVHRRMALGVIALVGTRPRRLILGVMIATAALSLWMNNTSTAMVMLPIGLSLIALVEERVGAAAAKNFSICMMLGIAYAASIGGIGTPIGTAPNAIALAALRTQYGTNIGFLAWTLAAMPVVALSLPLAWAVLCALVFPVKLASIPGGAAHIAQERHALGPMSRGEGLALAVFGLTVMCWLLREPLAALFPTLRPALTTRIDDAAIALGGAVLLFLIPVDPRRGQFVMDWATASRLPWDVLLLFGGGLSLASAIQQSGLGQFLGEQLGVLGGLPTLVIVGCVVTLAIFATEVMSNTALANIMVPIVGSLALALGLAPAELIVPMVMAVSMAYMLPMGTPPNALVFASGRVSIAQMARVGLVLNILCAILVTLVGTAGVRWAIGVERAAPSQPAAVAPPGMPPAPTSAR